MKPRVLVVDDSLTVRMDLCEAFEAAGFSATLCASAAAARDAWARATFDVAVLDVVLPDGDGLELLSRMKRDLGGSVPVMLLSTEAEVSARLRGLRTGADEYVGKPYDAAYVVARARQLAGLDRPRELTVDGPPLVLLIDDSRTVREALGHAITDAGYRFLAAASGEEGLRVAARERPAAIIVDGDLPGIDGSTVVRRMRLDNSLRTTPCILLTGSDGGGADELTALDAGADAYVRKGDDAGLVLARLAAVLRSAGAPVVTPGASSLLSPKKVLAVDDSPTYLDALAALLRGEGYDGVLATSGEEALELLAVQPVDCILLDLMLPGLSGNETCARIKGTATLRDIPLIMLTAREDRAAMIQGINAGADDYLSKSSEIEVLKARLRAQLRRKQFADENRLTHQQLLQHEIEVHEARAARALAEERASHLANLELKNLELARARDRAERESQFKSKFLASVSHELRTPLNAIIGFSELLQQDAAGPLEPLQREFVDDVVTSSRHLLELINDILDLSKIEAGKMELACEAISIGATIASVSRIIDALARKQGVTLEREIPEELPTIFADPLRMKQILYNLLSNAIKFTSAGGVVRIRVAIAAGEVRIDIVDSGLGIRPEDLPRLFTEFGRLAPSADVEGTGLGLPLTKRFIELHGGTISVTSSPGSGSCFTVLLPIEGPPGPRSSRAA